MTTVALGTLSFDHPSGFSRVRWGFDKDFDKGAKLLLSFNFVSRPAAGEDGGLII